MRGAIAARKGGAKAGETKKKRAARTPKSSRSYGSASGVPPVIGRARLLSARAHSNGAQWDFETETVRLSASASASMQSSPLVQNRFSTMHGSTVTSEQVPMTPVSPMKPLWTKGKPYSIVSKVEIVAKSWDKRGPSGHKKRHRGKDAHAKKEPPKGFAIGGQSALKRAVSMREKLSNPEQHQVHNHSEGGSMSLFNAAKSINQKDDQEEEVVHGLSPELVEKYKQFKRLQSQNHRESDHGFFLKHDSTTRTCVDIMSLTAVMYCTFMVPFDMVFTQVSPCLPPRRLAVQQLTLSQDRWRPCLACTDPRILSRITQAYLHKCFGRSRHNGGGVLPS